MGSSQSSLHSQTPRQETVSLLTTTLSEDVMISPGAYHAQSSQCEGYPTPSKLPSEEDIPSSHLSHNESPKTLLIPPKMEDELPAMLPQNEVHANPLVTPIKTEVSTYFDITSGAHTLVNVRSRTALDLSGGDSRSLIGFPAHYGENQQWRFIPFGEGYAIKSISSGLYLTVEDALVDGVKIIATPFPISWKVEYSSVEEETIRIMWPSEQFVFDMADYGSATPGTKVRLMPDRPDESCQWWRLHKVPSSKCILPQERLSTTSAPPCEAVVISKNAQETTITRTITTVTTVTTILKAPHASGL